MPPSRSNQSNDCTYGCTINPDCPKHNQKFFTADQRRKLKAELMKKLRHDRRYYENKGFDNHIKTKLCLVDHQPSWETKWPFVAPPEPQKPPIELPSVPQRPKDFAEFCRSLPLAARLHEGATGNLRELLEGYDAVALAILLNGGEIPKTLNSTFVKDVLTKYPPPDPARVCYVSSPIGVHVKKVRQAVSEFKTSGGIPLGFVGRVREWGSYEQAWELYKEQMAVWEERVDKEKKVWFHECKEKHREEWVAERLAANAKRLAANAKKSSCGGDRNDAQEGCSRRRTDHQHDRRHTDDAGAHRSRRKRRRHDSDSEPVLDVYHSQQEGDGSDERIDSNSDNDDGDADNGPYSEDSFACNHGDNDMNDSPGFNTSAPSEPSHTILPILPEPSTGNLGPILWNSVFKAGAAVLQSSLSQHQPLQQQESSQPTPSSFSLNSQKSNPPADSLPNASFRSMLNALNGQLQTNNASSANNSSTGVDLSSRFAPSFSGVKSRAEMDQFSDKTFADVRSRGGLSQIPSSTSLNSDNEFDFIKHEETGPEEDETSSLLTRDFHSFTSPGAGDSRGWFGWKKSRDDNEFPKKPVKLE